MSRFHGPLAQSWGENATSGRLVTLLDGARSKAGVPPVGDRGAWRHVDAVTTSCIRRRAEEEFSSPWPQPLVSHYARYFRDGNRTDYEGLVGDRQRRLTRAVLMVAITNEQRWLDEAVDGIMLLCEQSSWSWAAHDDTFSAHGHVIPTVDAPYLDLGAGEVAAQLAWTDVVLGEALAERAPGVRERMRWETEQRIFRPFRQRRDWHWLGLDGNVHNWNPWIHGNITLAALFLVDDPRLRADTVALTIEGLDRYLAALPPDGAIDEGFAYWWNGAGRALEMLQTLELATAGALDASGVPVVREVVSFPHRMHVAGPWYVNVADGPAKERGTEPWHVPYRWGLRIGDRNVVAHAASHRQPGEPVTHEAGGIGRVLRALFDPEWAAAAAPTAPSAPLVRHVWLPSVQVLVARQDAGTPSGLTLAAKGGHNGEHHNHKDVGSYSVAADGRPLIVDAGQPTYTAQTFGPDRYGIRTMQSGWHNTPAPCGLEQGVGARFRATEVEMSTGDNTDDDTDALSMRLETAYPLPPESSWHRTVRLERNAQRVVIADAWRLPAQPALIHHLLAGPVTLLDDHTAAVANPDGGRGLVLRWQPHASASLETWRLDDPLLTRVWGDRLTRLTLEAEDSLTLTVELAP